MQTARDWPAFAMLSRRDQLGGPSQIWSFADAMKTGDVGNYRESLGCGQ